MAQNVTIAGASYTAVPSIIVPKTGGGSAGFFDISDTTATAEDVLAGKYFYTAAGVRTEGTGSGGGGVEVTETLDSHGGTIIEITGATVPVLNPILLRPDAEKVATYTYDKKIHEDEGITIPAYTTTSTVLLASANLTPTYTVDLANYSYYIVERMLSIPEYSITTLAKGRLEYNFAATGYEIAVAEANTVHALIEPTRYVTSRSTSIYNTGNFARLVYYTSATAVGQYATAAYGAYQTVTAPAISSSTVTLKSPAFGVRGSTTYFVNTFMNALTDIRYQYVIEVWRAPKGNLSFDGWTCHNNMLAILNCVDGTTNKLR